MRLPGNPVATPVLTAIATSAATTAATLAAAHLTSLARLRLAERRATKAPVEDPDDDIDVDEDECTLDAGTYPPEHLILSDADGTSTGACIAALREKYLVENGSVTEILKNFDYVDLLRSFAETTIILAMNLADTTFEPCECDNEDCYNQEPDPEFHPMVGAKYLIFAAQSFEQRHIGHAKDCAVCAEAGPRARGMVRAQFCRDMADDLLTNTESNDMIVRGVPLQAAFDVVCSLMEIIENITGDEIDDQVEDLGKGLAFATGHVSGVPFGGLAN